MQTTISNEFLTVTIDTHGAEVVSVKNSKGEELIWQADPAIWDRHSQYCFRGLDDLPMVNWFITGSTIAVDSMVLFVMRSIS